MLELVLFIVCQAVNRLQVAVAVKMLSIALRDRGRDARRETEFKKRLRCSLNRTLKGNRIVLESHAKSPELRPERIRSAFCLAGDAFSSKCL